MSVKVAIDTNILVYSVLGEQEDVDETATSRKKTKEHNRKAAVAQQLIHEPSVFSIQVFNEFSNVMRKKHGFTSDEIRSVLEYVHATQTCAPLTWHTCSIALEIAKDYGYSTYDSLMLAAALLEGCDTLYSEDMQSGQVINGSLTIINPFL